MKRILVTGATGFVGSHMVKHLLGMGLSVRAIGRNLEKGLALSAMGADFRPVDLRDKQSVITVCENIDGVIHAGALSSPWGSYKNFHSINVGGTANILEGCARHGVKRLVYISSPSVMSRHESQIGLRETDPLPGKFVSNYSKTKKLAEDLVRNYLGDQLETVIIRPKAVYGPGDNAIFPRLIEAAAAKRLPIIGDGNTVINLTHIDDMVLALEKALFTPRASGRTYLITGDEEVRIWDNLKIIIDALGLPKIEKRLSTDLAMKIAAVLELIWRLLPLKSEPPLTRYSVGILAYSETYDITAAKTELGYKPTVTIKDGLQSIIENYRNQQTGFPVLQSKSDIKNSHVDTFVTIFNSGFAHTRQIFFEPGGSWKKIRVPAMFALIQHPIYGPILFDTGYTSRFFQGTQRFPFRLYRMITPVSHSVDQSAVEQLKKNGVNPEDIKWIFLSHFDPDHYGGLKDFPNARIVCSWRAWESVRHKKGLKALLKHILPNNLPDDLSAKLMLLPDFNDEAGNPFGNKYDFFKDGSMRLVSLPGHASGQFGAFVKDGSKEYFLVADAIWSQTALKSPQSSGIHGLVAANPSQCRETVQNLERFNNNYPEVVLVPTHCPEAYASLVRKSQKVDWL